MTDIEIKQPEDFRLGRQKVHDPRSRAFAMPRSAIKPTGGEAGGHQWIVRGYDKGQDLAMGRCWWNGFRDFWIKRSDLDSLLRDGGDAHFTRTVSA